MENQSQKPVAPTSANVQEIIRKGEEIYAGLKTFLEPIHNGKYVVIEINSGRHFLGETRDEATAKARQEFPEQIMFVRKVGQVEKSSRHLSKRHYYTYARLF